MLGQLRDIEDVDVDKAQLERIETPFGCCTARVNSLNLPARRVSKIVIGTGNRAPLVVAVGGVAKAVSA